MVFLLLVFFLEWRARPASLLAKDRGMFIEDNRIISKHYYI
jgi:hypothetical protein